MICRYPLLYKGCLEVLHLFRWSTHTHNDVRRMTKHVWMSRSATPATRNEATPHVKPPGIVRTVADGCERLRTVANGCGRLRTVGQRRANTPSTPRPPEWNGNPCYAFGKKKRNWWTHSGGLAFRNPELSWSPRLHKALAATAAFWCTQDSCWRVSLVLRSQNFSLGRLNDCHKCVSKSARWNIHPCALHIQMCTWDIHHYTYAHTHTRKHSGLNVFKHIANSRTTTLQ